MQVSTINQRPSRARSARSARRQPSGCKQLKWDLTVIPVRLDQTPGEVCWSNRCQVNESDSVVSIEIDRQDPFPGRSIVVGASIDGPTPAFAVLTIESQHQLDAGLRVDARISEDPGQDILSDHLLSPRIDARRFRFHYGYPEDILTKWESIGVLRKYLVDRILVCPDCGSIPTWRHACPSCGSGRYRRTRLIHHFACAHVDHARAFRSAHGGLRCPKCQETKLIAGTDYQYVAGPLACFDCEERGSQPTLYCMCHLCLSRFDPDTARDQELYGYHVDRLDLPGFVAASE